MVRSVPDVWSCRGKGGPPGRRCETLSVPPCSGGAKSDRWDVGVVLGRRRSRILRLLAEAIARALSDTEGGAVSTVGSQHLQRKAYV